MPGMQKPHCTPPHRENDSAICCRRSSDRPSSVTRVPVLVVVVVLAVVARHAVVPVYPAVSKVGDLVVSSLVVVH